MQKGRVACSFLQPPPFGRVPGSWAVVGTRGHSVADRNLAASKISPSILNDRQYMVKGEKATESREGGSEWDTVIPHRGNAL